ncbi:uncharacterized protein LOC129744077 [Uranotaenia lowii]|uniref:uncharacterized protein LOC129744077 n=1 Tax=Uranotaenia lowii TaxID=190385 RepID=UPI002478BAB4|nr:uncharacterized protein LOC129744077 [Uranotaenia lowii]
MAKRNNSRSSGENSTNDMKRLMKELEEEKMLNASLRSELRMARGGNKTSRNLSGWIEEDLDGEDNNFFGQRNSTMRGADESTMLTSMTLASLQIGECRPLEGEDEIDKKSFEQWRNIFESALKIAGIADESTKISIFKMKAGAKLIDVLESTPNVESPDEETSPYSNVMCRLQEYYGSRNYTLLQRQKLRSMPQASGESDLKYMKRVVAVAKLCDYNADQLVETVADVVQKAREAARKVMRKGGSLQGLMNKVRAAEIEKQNEEIFARNHQPSSMAEIAAVSYSRSSQNFRGRFASAHRGRGSYPRGRGFSGGIGTTFVRTACWRCTGHFHRPHECHAIDKECRRCHVMGHIERACGEAIGSKRRASDDIEPNSAPRSKIAAITVAEESEMNENEDKKPVSVPSQ